MLGEAVHRMSHQVSELLTLVQGLKDEYDVMRPVIEGYKRGGVLAARTALRRTRV